MTATRTRLMGVVSWAEVCHSANGNWQPAVGRGPWAEVGVNLIYTTSQTSWRRLIKELQCTPAGFIEEIDDVVVRGSQDTPDRNLVKFWQTNLTVGLILEAELDQWNTFSCAMHGSTA